MNFNPTVTPDDILMSSANGHGPRVCIHCLRAVGHWHRPSCIVTKERYALAERKPKPARYRYAGLGLLLALALAGCGDPVARCNRCGAGIWDKPHGYMVNKANLADSIAQADPRTEADWPGLAGKWDSTTIQAYRYGRSDAMIAATALTVTNGTPRHLLLEQGDRVTLAQPDSSYTLPAGAITIREAREYDD